MARNKARVRPVSSRRSPLAQQSPLVSGRWLLWWLAAIFGGGFFLVYLTSCLLFWQGQWQILFHPARTTLTVPATIGLPLEEVHFGTTETGEPRLDGWYIPAAQSSRYASETLLYLHSMKTGSLADAVPELTVLHQLGINIVAFDYRGFGRSQEEHPSEELASEDTEAAWDYLTNTRHVSAASLVFDGVGLGASLAAEAAERHPDAGGLIIDSPLPGALELLRQDRRSRWMPVRLLAHDRFDPRAALKRVQTPKLFLLAADVSEGGKKLARDAADPKRIVYLPVDGGATRLDALTRFLDELPRH